LAGECPHGIAGTLRRERRHGARVEASGKVGRDRDVASKVELHGLLEQGAEALLEETRRVVHVDLVVDLPVAFGLDATARPQSQNVAGQQLANSLEQRLAREAQLKP